MFLKCQRFIGLFITIKKGKKLKLCEKVFSPVGIRTCLPKTNEQNKQTKKNPTSPVFTLCSLVLTRKKNFSFKNCIGVPLLFFLFEVQSLFFDSCIVVVLLYLLVLGNKYIL